ncbi:MAG: DUF433 domain-containing protein [Planctomycetes bacterium]|nr:DUF433 domain-containing protein [Planctomycetota bacterium]
MVSEITLIDKGRGLQLSTSRITVMDLVQYFKHDWSYEEIMQWIPSLTREEIAVVEAYYREHKNELDEEDRKIDEYREEQARLQALRFPIPDETREEKLARFRKLLKAREEKNGEGNPR